MGRASLFLRTNERVVLKVRGDRDGGCRDLASSTEGGGAEGVTKEVKPE